MSSLIIALISVGLVALLALSSLYYGGPIWQEAAVRVNTAQLLAEAQQVEGAVQLFEVETGRKPSGPAELAAGGIYLKSVPAEWNGGPAYLSTMPTNSSVSQESCLLFNQKRLGISEIPSCTDPLYTASVICCEDPPVFAN